MNCPVCKYPQTTVVDTNPHNFKQLISRRRECLRCQHRFTTYEIPKDAPKNKESGK
jgi:transcriptional repressor NrdR